MIHITNDLKKPNRIHTFSYIRILMCFSIVLTHWILFLDGDSFKNAFEQYHFNEFAVSFFFLVSGFFFRKSQLNNDVNGLSYKSELITVLNRKKDYIIKYTVIIIMSAIYYTIAHFVTGKYSMSEVLWSCLSDLLFLSTALNINSLTMNAGWFFQCLMHFWILSPFINRIIRFLSNHKGKVISATIIVSVIYIISLKGIYMNLYYNSLARVFEVIIGMLIYECVLTTSSSSAYLFTCLEVLGIVLIFYPFYRLSLLDYYFSRTAVTTLVNCIYIYIFGCNRGLISKYLFKKNVIVDYMSGCSFDVYIYHFTFFHFLSLSPKLYFNSEMMLLLEAILLSIVFGKIISYGVVCSKCKTN